MLDLKKYSGARFLLLVPFLLTACTYTLKIKDGRTAYDRRQYAVAAPMLEKEFARAKTRTEKGQLAFLLGDAYRRNGQDDQALPWFKTAYDNNYGAEALKAYAYGLKKLERYAEARDAFKDLGIEIGSPYEYRKEITAATIAEGWKKEQPSNGWSAEGAPFNSAQNDFAPVRYADGRLVFTSDRAMSAGEDAYGWTGNRFMDLFIVEPGGASAQVFDPRLNSPANEGTACFNADFTEIFFVRALGAYKGDDAYCKIYSAEQNGGAWSDPKPLPFQKEKINYLHPALSADGLTLFFASNDPEGLGGYDLYAVAREPRSENGWGEPRILSRNLNTTANEVFPTVEADTLYFSSDGLPGMGGLDIFRTYRSDRGAWSPPINLKAPVNSGADEFAFTVDMGGAGADGLPAEARRAEDSLPSSALRASAGKPGDLLRSGFFTSNRPGGRGGDDIYRFEQRVPPPAPPRRDTVPARPLAYKMVLEGYVLEKIYTEAENPNSKVLARRPLGGATVLIDAAGKKQTVTVKDDGFFTLELNENSDYTFTASQPGYLANSTRFSTRGIARDPAQPVQTFEVEIVLDKIFRDREIVLENIYYDYDKWDIRPDAEPTLNRLADVLRQNPGVRIQLGSHTDCRGNDDYNRDLAQKRAESAVNYLIAKGIEASRLSALGYGESQPAADCACARCTEADHQANRRTTFKVMEGGAGF